jgi:hypothetical protein
MCVMYGTFRSWRCKKYPAVAGYSWKKRAIVVDVFARNILEKNLFKLKEPRYGNKEGSGGWYNIKGLWLIILDKYYLNLMTYFL